MPLTRRRILGLFPLAVAAPHLFGQDLEIRNAAGISVSPIGDLQKPVLGLRLPGQTPGYAAVIEMPEHAWAKPRGSSEQQWFYRLFSDQAGSGGNVRWERDGSTLRYRMATPKGFSIATEARLEEDGLAIAYEINNPSEMDYGETQAVTCIKLYRPFTDVFLERTYVHHPDGLDLLASETPERLTMNAEEWLPVRYIARCQPPATPADQRYERQPDRIVFRRKLRLADAPFLATASFPAGWVAATHTLDCPSVWSNPARTCHHADPSAALPPKSGARLALKFYVIRGTPQDVWARVSRQRAAGKA